MSKNDVPSRLAASVPPDLNPLFNQAQQRVEEYFSHITKDIPNGILRLGNNRHLMLRGDALGVEFFKIVRTIYGESNQTTDIANAFLFDLSHAIGAADAQKFIHVMDLNEPLEKLAVGPIYFAHAGFARVVIQPGSNPTPDDNFVLYYRHENSFEAESWKKGEIKVQSPVCILSTGYSSGWCSAAFDIPLVATEYACEAAGDEGCDFVMAPPHRIDEYLAKIPNIRHSLYVPKFFGRREHDEHMQALAYRDALTNLSNRAFFTEVGSKLLQFAIRNGCNTGLLFLDLDDFKDINDNFGHAAGDHVLQVVAKRLQGRLRSSDVIARFGGDEFTVFIEEVEENEPLEMLAKDLIDAINEPIEHLGRTCRVGVSIGGAYFNSGTEVNLEQLIAEADAAMYEAKKAGKNDYRIRLVES
ncbi:MAG: diguanylate cyclase [Gammaproteobacteria bacterium]|nr:diguanylate cyclase [Gammaproteobacteria bacterium]